MQQTNLLFKSDNLTALKALAKTHQKAIKCAYFDPPYNTGIDRKHFRDSEKSCDWITMICARLEALIPLMRSDGSIWISIDDSELYNLKHLCDALLGKENFLATVVWQHKIHWEGYKGLFQLDHTYLLGYRMSQAFHFENNARPSTVWLEADVGGRSDALEESEVLFGKDHIFSTPKPERLMRYLLSLTSKKEDIILDAFSGSGTMGASAQKMQRRWIMIEKGDQCETHILPRLQKISAVFSYFPNITAFEQSP